MSTRRPVVLIVRDGWGHNPYPEMNACNAIHLARTPVDDALLRETEQFPPVRRARARGAEAACLRTPAASCAMIMVTPTAIPKSGLSNP